MKIHTNKDSLTVSYRTVSEDYEPWFRFGYWDDGFYLLGREHCDKCGEDREAFKLTKDQARRLGAWLIEMADK